MYGMVRFQKQTAGDKDQRACDHILAPEEQEHFHQLTLDNKLSL